MTENRIPPRAAEGRTGPDDQALSERSWPGSDRRAQAELGSLMVLLPAAAAMFLRLCPDEWLAMGTLCPFRRLTGVVCPFCGMTRDFHGFLEARWAFLNPASPAVFLVLFGAVPAAGICLIFGWRRLLPKTVSVELLLLLLLLMWAWNLFWQR